MTSTYLSAEQAARRLGVSLPTLYAYVSRGLVTSHSEDGKRRRRYLAEEIEALVARRAEKGGAERALAGALHWGEPLCESALTLIQDGSLYYRGRDACELARTASWEEVAALLWGQDGSPTRDVNEFDRSILPALPAGLPPIERFRLALPWLALADPRGYDLRPEGIRRSGSRILTALVALAGEPGKGEKERVAGGASDVSEALSSSPRAASSLGSPTRSASSRRSSSPSSFSRADCSTSPSLAELLADAWAPGRRPILEAALVLCADHELNVSAFTARCVASAGATPYDVVAGGLAALSGHRHGGHCGKVEAMFAEAERVGARETLLRRMREGVEVAGFAHPLYPSGDPRGRCLLEMLGPSNLTSELIAEASDLLGVLPNIDFALVAVARALGLPQGGALGLFALGRTVGWIAHALEQVATGQLIRPRARYIGENPTFS